uniref:Integrin subunit alpha 6 n=1 Tax=Lates calcarifer TaxID=8187 RepID=A0A4W6FBV4_LATCA
MVYLWSVLHFQTLNVAAFNLDTKNVLQRNGDPGSLFGFSVAFHQQYFPPRLLVGAPRSKHQNQVNVTGVVYHAFSAQCNCINIVPLSEFSLFIFLVFLNSKDINDQWMGVRVTSQGPGQNVMTCAHRYQQWCPNPSKDVCHLLTGQCYLLGNDLKVGNEDRLWRRVVCDKKHLTTHQKHHDWFAYCQQGHGASFAKDNKSVLFGAPGAYHWKGIVRMELLDNLGIASENPRETGDIGRFNTELIPLHRDSYLGFSIDSGMALIRKGELTIVSGAPRGGFSGQVTFLRADPAAKRNLLVELVLSGPGLASSFGYDVTVVDFNGDGWDDLAVGAPQFCVKDDVEVGGAVYVYINNKGKNWKDVVPTQLLGNKDSMFGIAVENIGDINQDGYGDIAVGAPYSSSGRVYIYCGSSDGIHKNEAQVLSSGSQNIHLFGYSLSGNLDIDDNQYPDLAVGSLSNSVFVYSNGVVSVALIISYVSHVVLNYTFKADAKSRVNFCGSPQGKLELPGQRTNVCTDTKLQLQVLSHWLFFPFHKRHFDINNFLICCFSQIILINRGCGSDNICQSNLELQYKFCSRQTQNEQIGFKSLAREDGVAVIIPSEEGIALEITVTNRNGDDAHQSHLIIKKSIDCELGNPFQRDAEVTFYVILNTSNISLSTTDVKVTLQLETTSNQTIQQVEAVAKVFFELVLQVTSVAKPSQVLVSLGERLIGESAIKSVDEIGPSVQYKFRIKNMGRPLKSFANVSLNILWPKENSVGKWLLYLTQNTSKDVQSVSCSPVNEFNPLKHINGWHEPSRKRREAEHEALSTNGFPFFPTKRKFKTLNCSDGLKCVEIRCPLLDLDSTAAIILHAQLWNTTFTEDYSDLNYLVIVVNATLSLTSSPDNIRLKPEKHGTQVKQNDFAELLEKTFVFRHFTCPLGLENDLIILSSFTFM